MLVPSLPLLLTLLIAQNASSAERMDCEDIRRIEMSQPSIVSHEVCVSAGFMTGFFFEAPVSVEIQDELRFEEVARGRTSISVIPPRDMAPGERFRLSARYLDNRQAESVTLLLVATPGLATRQIEVFRDTRTRESFERELKQERARSQRSLREVARLRSEFEQLRQQYADHRQLRGLIASGSMTQEGIRARAFKPSLVGRQDGEVLVLKGVSYSSENRTAIEVWLVNSGPDPWRLEKASVRDEHGVKMKTAYEWQPEDSARNVAFLVIVELELKALSSIRECTLTLYAASGHEFTIPGIEIP